MTTSPPQVNGHTRPTPVIEDWLPGSKEAPATVTPKTDPVAEAEADAIRTRAYAEAEARRIAAEAEAKATAIKAEAEAEKQRLANDRAAMAAEEKRAAHNVRMASIAAEQAEIDRRAAEAGAQAEAEQQAAAATAEKIAAADVTWRRYAIAFYAVCAIVALPVQIAAFWDPQAWWLVIAPLMLEGAALVVTKGAAAAVAAHRPHWHYRTVAWMFAFIAAGINLWHGMAAFDPATAIGTAFASLAGPGVWDLHEHGRIRRRDGVLSRRERKAQTKTEKAAAAEKAAAQQKSEAEKKAAAQAAEAAAQKLAADRERDYPDEWKYAVKLASAMGETGVTEKVWDRTFDVMHASKPGDTAADIRTRNIAVRRLEAARSEAPGSKPVKATSSQRASQMPATSKTRVYNPPARPGRRRKGDTPKYVAAARKQAAITARITK